MLDQESHVELLDELNKSQKIILFLSVLSLSLKKNDFGVIVSYFNKSSYKIYFITIILWCQFIMFIPF
jgi:hypothetical protein